MFINKWHNSLMILWAKTGNVNKILGLCESSLELRKMASNELHCERLVNFVTGRNMKSFIEGE